MKRLIPLSVVFLCATLQTACGAGESAPASAAGTNVLAELSRSLAATTNVVADFVQEKELSLLKRKITLTGRLAVQSPDRMAWHIKTPVRFSLVVTGSHLQQWDEETGAVQSVPLGRNPVFGVVSRLLRGGLGGDMDSLLSDFEPRLISEQPLQVEFTPRETSITGKVIRRITLTFRADRRYVDRIAIEQLDGDRTVISFGDARLNTAIDPAVWEVKPRGE